MVRLRRGWPLLLALLALVTARVLAPSPGMPTGASAAYSALGPFRPLVAELRLLQFREQTLHFDEFAELDRALTILSLRPDRVDLWEYFANRFVRDQGFRRISAADQQDWVRAGFEVLRQGLVHLPTASVLWLTQGECLASLLLHHPDLLGAVRRGTGTEEVWLEVLEDYGRAYALAPPNTKERALSREQLLQWLRMLLEGESVPLTPAGLATVRKEAADLLDQGELRPQNERWLREAVAEER